MPDAVCASVTTTAFGEASSASGDLFARDGAKAFGGAAPNANPDWSVAANPVGSVRWISSESRGVPVVSTSLTNAT
ncbi:MAG: hypothetical protein AAFY60_21130, partial [Myxococcota bacterium]